MKILLAMIAAIALVTAGCNQSGTDNTGGATNAAPSTNPPAAPSK